MRIRFGIVGAGMIADIHAQAIAAIKGASLTGVMDNGSGRGAIIAPGTDTTGNDDLNRFLARDDIDIITIASPSGTHADIAVEAASAGKHCIVEKPLDVSLAKIDRMIDAHRQAGTALGGIFNSRYSDAAQLLKRTVEQGRFGRMTFAAAQGPWWRDQSYYDDSDWKGTWALDGGGALMNQGIHSVDLLQWLVDSPVTTIQGQMATLAHERVEVEDTASATLCFANGALGTIACTTSMWPGHFRTITLSGTNGTAVLADSNLLVWRFREEKEEDDEIRRQYLNLPGEGIGASNPAAGVTADGHRAVFEEFLAALNENRSPIINGAESRKAVEIILAIYQSARNSGNAVSLPLTS